MITYLPAIPQHLRLATVPAVVAGPCYSHLVNEERDIRKYLAVVVAFLPKFESTHRAARPTQL